jgi:hypothetical protein
MGLVKLGRDHNLPIIHTSLKVIFQYQAQQHLTVMGQRELHIHNVMVLVGITLVQSFLYWMRMFIIVYQKKNLITEKQVIM